MTLLLSSSTRTELSAVKSNANASYLFVGPSAVGKATAAKEIASKLTNHPGDIIVVKPTEASIGIAQIHELNQRLQLKSFKRDHGRAVIVDDAHKLTVEAQSALLKLLEETPEHTTMILIAESRQKLLPTILSRCQTINFNKLPADVIKHYLQTTHKLSAKLADELARLSDGCVGMAVAMAADELLLENLRLQHQQALTLQQGDLYQKVLMGSQVVADKTVAQVLAYLEKQLHQGLRHAIAAGDRVEQKRSVLQLLKMQRWQNYLGANGNPKFAIDNLVLEL